MLQLIAGSGELIAEAVQMYDDEEPEGSHAHLGKPIKERAEGDPVSNAHCDF